MRRVPLRAVVLLGAACVGIAFGVRHATSLTNGMEGMAVGLVGGGLLILLWEADIAWTFSLVLAFTMFSGYTKYIHLPIGPDRVLFALGVVRLIWEQWRSGRALGAWRTVHWLLAASVVWVVVSAAWAGTLTHSAGFYALLDRFGIVPFVVYAFAGRIFGTRHQRRVLLGVLTAVGFYLGLTALFEFVHLNALIWPKYILNPNVGIQEGRARGPFAESVADGLAMFSCGVAAAIATLQWRRWARLFAVATILLCGLGIVLTLTRAVWLGSAVGVLVTLGAFRQLRRYVIPVAVSGAIIVALALLLIPGFAGSASSRLTSQLPVWDRLNTNYAALRMIGDHPAVGVGWMEFPNKDRPYFRQARNYPITGIGIEVHNVFLSRWVELGLLGGTLWLITFLTGMTGALLRRAPPELEPWRVGFMAVVIQWVIVANFGPLPYAFANLLVWLWAGMVTEGRVPVPVRMRTPVEPPRRWTASDLPMGSAPELVAHRSDVQLAPQR